MSRKRVKLAVEVIFDGDYYELSELVDVAGDWICGSFEDRDDCREWTITGTAEEIAPEVTS